MDISRPTNKEEEPKLRKPTTDLPTKGTEELNGGAPRGRGRGGRDIYNDRNI